MDIPKLPFSDSKSKWLQSTSIAAYLIIAAALLALFYSGWMAYGVMYSEDTSGEAFFKGSVRDSNTKAGLAGVNVSIVDTGLHTSTNSKGDYQFNNTPAGRLNLLFTYPGYRAVELEVLVAESSEDEREKIDTVSMVAFEKNNIVTTLKPASLEGVVFSSISNSPVDEAVVAIRGSSQYFDTNGLQYVASLNLSKETGAQGTFQFTNLPFGVLELHVKVYFNETYWRANHKVRVYEHVTTFLPSEGNTTSLNISFDGSAWAGLTEDLTDPYTFTYRDDIRQQRTLTINLNPEAKASGTPFSVNVYNQGTGALVFSDTDVASTTEVDLDEGIYTITAYNMYCRMTVARNVSVHDDRSVSLTMRYGAEPIEDDQADDLGYYQCAIINLILAIVGCVGAFFCFTRKKYLVAMVGAMACVLSRSPLEIIPGICNFNMILGIIAFLFIFRSRDKFLDSPPPLPNQEAGAAPGSSPDSKGSEKTTTEPKPAKPKKAPAKRMASKAKATSVGRANDAVKGSPPDTKGP